MKARIRHYGPTFAVFAACLATLELAARGRASGARWRGGRELPLRLVDRTVHSLGGWQVVSDVGTTRGRRRFLVTRLTVEASDGLGAPVVDGGGPGGKSRCTDGARAGIPQPHLLGLRRIVPLHGGDPTK